MAGEVKVSVRSELQKIIEQLEQIREKSGEVSDTLKTAGKDTGDVLSDQVKKTEGFFAKLQSIGGRVADQLRGDFRSLLSINALEGALKLSNQFQGSIKETISLSDAIRKLGASFGISGKDFVKFQETLTKGMGDIGLSSEEAAMALKGLAGTGLRGEGNILKYAQTSAQLASLGGEKGRGGDIAGLLAGVVRERGGNIQDPAQMQLVAKAVTKAMESTGKGATEILQTMQQTFAAMPKELRQKMSPDAVAQLSVASTVAGPQAIKPLQKFLSMSREERAGMEAQGFGKIFGAGGQLDLKGLRDVARELKGRGVSSRLAAQTMGFQGEEAEGLVRLIDSADVLADALDRTSQASDDYAKKARQNMGLSEAFNANINKVKSLIGGPLSSATQGLTDMLSGASESTAGAGAVVAGGGVLAALLAGGALRGIGGGMLGGIAGTALKTQAAETITGQKTIPVYVTNAAEIASGGALSGAAGALGGVGGIAGKAGKFLGAGAGVLGAGAAGAAIGTAINEIPGVSDAIVAGFEKIASLFGGGPKSDEEIFAAAQKNQMNVKVQVYDEKNRELKNAKQPNRGASN